MTVSPEIAKCIAVSVKINNVVAGSAALIKIANAFYLISANHVFSDVPSDDEELDYSSYVFESEAYDIIEHGEVISETRFMEQNDVICFRVPDGSFPNYPDVKFCDDHKHPENEFSFRGSSKKNQVCRTIFPCFRDSSGKDAMISLKIPGDFNSDGKGDVGAENLDGYSGSCVLSSTNGRTYLHGVVLRATEGSHPGVDFKCIGILNQLDIPDFELSEFFGGNHLLLLNVAKHSKSITNRVINEAKSRDNIMVENLTRKMDCFLPDWDESTLDEYIGEILLWDKIQHKHIKNDETLSSIVDETIQELKSGNQHYMVESVLEGNRKYHDIESQYYDSVARNVRGTILEKYIKILANGKIAEYLANCKIRFSR